MAMKYFRYFVEGKASVLWRNIEEARTKGGESVLDVGCATGGTLQALGSAGFGQLTGLDLSPRMLDSARAKRLARTSLVEATVESEPFAPESFDGIAFYGD